MSDFPAGIVQKIHSLTLEEKARLISGGGDFWHTLAVPRLGIHSLALHDGPHGLRKQGPKVDNAGLQESLAATCYPSLSAVASSFDPELAFELGQALGAEARSAGVDVLLAPGVNIKRHPLCGRNFEYLSEDPLLTGEMASGYIKGVQSQGVAANLKHFAANNQEFCRMVNSSDVDERAMREIYLKPFEIAIRQAQPWTVMSSYNRVNGVYACEHLELLTEIARNEWGFEGLFVTDWGGMDDRAQAISAGTDLEMPPVGAYGVERILEGVRSGHLAESAVDRAVGKILELIEKVRQNQGVDKTWQTADFDAVAKRAAVESAVLLKNQDALLPLADGLRVVMVGELAERPHYQGAGSSRVNPRRLISALDAKQDEALNWDYTRGYRLGAQRDERLESEALELCRGKDVVLFFAGHLDTSEAEGYDRLDLDLPEAQNALIERIASQNPNVIVVLQCGSPVRLPWFEKVKGVLLMGLGGQMVGSAALDLLLGRANPSGKLAETWPLSLEDTPAYGQFGGRYHTLYRESVFVGYRYYESFNIPVRFPFGYGLSYTSFDISDIRTSQTRLEPDGKLEVFVTVSNTGTRAGREVLQLYVSPPSSTLFRPRKELKAFQKVMLAPGESQDISFTLRQSAFACWNAEIHDWHCEAGSYRILIGTSAASAPLEATIELVSDRPGLSLSDYRNSAPEYYANRSGKLVVSDQAFEAVLGRTLPQDKPEPKARYDLNTTLWDVRDRLRGKLIGFVVRRISRKLIGGDEYSREVNERIIQASTIDAPIRSYVVGGVSMSIAEGIVLLLNGKMLKGLKKLLEK